MSAAPTAGTWRAVPCPVECNAQVRAGGEGAGGQLVAIVWSGRAASLDVATANANLIAAAPDLLAALATLLREQACGRTPLARDWTAARRAYAKACGVQS